MHSTNFVINDLNPSIYDSYMCSMELSADVMGVCVNFVDMGFQRYDGAAPIQIEVIDGIPQVSIWSNINATKPQIISLEKASVSSLNKTPKLPPQDILDTLAAQAKKLIEGIVYKYHIKEINTDIMYVLFLNVHNAHIDCDDYSIVCHSPNTSAMELCQVAFEKFGDDYPDDIYSFITELDDYHKFMRDIEELYARGAELEKQYMHFSFNNFLHTEL